jgi:hypothetical protein
MSSSAAAAAAHYAEQVGEGVGLNTGSFNRQSQFTRSTTRKSYGTVKLDNIETLTGANNYNT